MKPVKRRVIADYESPYPESIKFEKGEQVRIGEKFEKDSDWKNWYWGEGQQGKKAWVPIQYIDVDGGCRKSDWIIFYGVWCTYRNWYASDSLLW